MIRIYWKNGQISEYDYDQNTDMPPEQFVEKIAEVENDIYIEQHGDGVDCGVLKWEIS